MTRTELADRIGYCRKELTGLEAIVTGCQSCQELQDGACRLYGPVPADFMAKGCDDWVISDEIIPF